MILEFQNPSLPTSILDSALISGSGNSEVRREIIVIGDASGASVSLVSGSVPVVVENGTPISVSGTVAVTQSTSPWVISGTVTANQGTANAGSKWSVQVDNASAIAVSEATLDGAISAGKVQVNVTNASLAVTQATSPWTDNLTQVAGVILGATAVTNFGSAPAATAVPGINASLFAGNVPLSASLVGSTPVEALNVNIVNSEAISILGSVTVNQGTNPWVVAGNLTHNNAAPAANNIGALIAMASAAAPVYGTGDQVLLSTDLAGNLRVSITGSVIANNNITEWNSVALGSPTSFGVAPSGNVIGTNASLFAGTVALSASLVGSSPVEALNVNVVNSEAISILGTVTVAQSSSWIDDLTQVAGVSLGAGAVTSFGFAPAAGNVLGVNASLFAGNVPLSVSLVGSSPVEALNVNVVNSEAISILGSVTVNQGAFPWVDDLTRVAGVSLGAGAVTSFGFAPAAGNVQGVNASIFAGNVPLSASLVGSTPVEALNVNIVNSEAISILGSVTVNQGTSPWVTEVSDGSNILFTLSHAGYVQFPSAQAVTLTSTTITGTVAVTQSTSPWVVNLTQVSGTALGSTAVTNFGSAPAAAAVPGVNASLFAGTIPLSASLVGSSPVEALNVNVVNSEAISILGTVTVAQSSTWIDDLTQVAGVSLGAGAVTSFGNAPAAGNVPGVNASLFAGAVPLSASLVGSSPVEALNVNVVNSEAISILGSVTVNQGTQPWVDDLTRVAGVSLGAGAVTSFGLAPAAGNVQAVNASLFAGSIPLSASLVGSSPVEALNVNVVNSEAISILGTVTVAQNTTWIDDLTQVAGVSLGAGAVTSFGFAPAAGNVPGVNASLFAGNVPLSVSLVGSSPVEALNVNVVNSESISILGSVTVNQGALPWVDDLTRVAGVSLGAGAVTSFGFAPAPGNVQGVNASLFAGNVPLSASLVGSSPVECLNVNIVESTAISILGTVNIAGTLSNNNAAPGANNVGVLGAIANAANPSWTEGKQVGLSVDLIGALRVNVVEGSAGNAAAGATGSPVPADADYIGVNISGNLTGVTGFSLSSTKAAAVAIVDGSGNQITSFGGGTQFADNAASGATPTGTLAMGWDSVNSKIRALKVDASQNLDINASAVAGVALGSTAVVNFGTAPAAAAVPGVNASLFAGTVPLSASLVGSSPVEALNVNVVNSEAISILGSVTVNQGTAAIGAEGWPIIGGNVAEVSATWNSSTPINTILSLNVKNYNVVVLTFAQSAPIISGAVLFEVADALGNWYPVVGNLITGSTSGQISNVGIDYSFVAGTDAAFVFNVSGFVQFRVRISSVIVGAGSVVVGIAAQYGTTPVVLAKSPITQILLGDGFQNLATLISTEDGFNVGMLQYPLVFNGASWDRLRSGTSTGSVLTSLKEVAGTALGATAVTNFGSAPAAAAVPGVNASLFAGTTPLSASLVGSAPVEALNVNVVNSEAISILGSVGVTQSTTPWVANIEGTKNTYSAFASFIPQAGDIAVLPGSASKTIRVTRVEISLSTTGTAAIESVQLIKRSSADSGGTSSAMAIVDHDSAFPAATAVPLSYTAAPTLGNLVGVVRGIQFNDQSSTLPGSAAWIWTFGDGRAGASCIVLRGTAQQLCVNLSAAVATQTATVSWEWTEE